MRQPKLIVILGPTASGKTNLAVQLAHKIDGEIISADSRQVYRGMDIGTGKDLNEYCVKNQQITYHLIDVVNAGESYNLFQFQIDFYKSLDDILSRNKTPILCGGSGLYLEAVLKGHQFTAIPNSEALRENLESYEVLDLLKLYKSFDTDFQKVADVSSKKRLIRAIEISIYLTENIDFKLPDFPQLPPTVIYGLNPEKELRRQKISNRLKERFENGMIDEVKKLLENNISAEKLVFYGLEYKYITEYLLGGYDFETMFSKLEIAIHQFAKRQMTFFRKMEKDGLKINWIDKTQPLNKFYEEVADFLC